jgi:hypothetical protein
MVDASQAVAEKECKQQTPKTDTAGSRSIKQALERAKTLSCRKVVVLICILLHSTAWHCVRRARRYGDYIAFTTREGVYTDRERIVRLQRLVVEFR